MEKFRSAEVSDAKILLDLTQKAYRPIRELGITFDTAYADLDFVKKNINDNLCFILESEEGEVLGTISLRMPWGDRPGPFGVPHIWWFAVDPLIGGSGVGSKLLKWCEESVVRDLLKSPAVSLGTADNHPWLVQMYEQRGYHILSRRDSGKGYGIVSMKKELL
ncbi:GNAT family N-acetyltransferase [Bacillus gobiensis]|uniref:GNAT family N-acetyltransferase n=1 Tax=Bacillus gobiensis TaxID=1441095 RepID=UPI003D2569A1